MSVASLDLRIAVDLDEAPPDGAPAEEIVRWAIESHDPERVAVVTGLQAEGVAVADMALAVDPQVRIVTVDTGRLPPETHAYIDTLRAHFGCTIDVVNPDPRPLEAFVREHGVNPFYRSADLRLECCHHRKVAPLEPVLAGLDCWLVGLRQAQSLRRSQVRTIAPDPTHPGLVKVSPLATWTDQRVDDYLQRRRIPPHPLYLRGYQSIGCAPCTRAVAPGEDPRAGRWWWEQGVDKECGIHGPAVVAQESAG